MKISYWIADDGSIEILDEDNIKNDLVSLKIDMSSNIIAKLMEIKDSMGYDSINEVLGYIMALSLKRALNDTSAD